MNDNEFEPGELFIYVNGSSYEIGKVKRPNGSGDGYFCWYHTGMTASNTPTRCMHKLVNAYVIDGESLGGLDGMALENFHLRSADEH